MKWKSIILYSLLILASQPAHSTSVSVLIIKSHNTPLYNNASKGIAEHINKNYNVTIRSLEPKGSVENKTLQQTDIIIAIGSHANDYIFSHNTSKPIVSILIPKSYYFSLKNKYSNAQIAVAIFVDQPLDRKSEQIKIILPNAKKIGIISSLPQEKLDDKINILKKDFLVNYATIDSQENILNTFRKISLQSDAILADPDNLVYNKNTIKRILISSYRSNTPIIGYSEALTRAGALISIHSPPYYIGKETAEIMNGLTLTKLSQTPIEKHPKYYTVSVNERVAHSMKIPLNTAKLTDEILTDQK